MDTNRTSAMTGGKLTARVTGRLLQFDFVGKRISIKIMQMNGT